MSHYRITVSHQGRTVQVFPSQRRDRDTDLTETCTRIGMMIMSESIETITVYRDGQPYREYAKQQVREEAQAESTK